MNKSVLKFKSLINSLYNGKKSEIEHLFNEFIKNGKDAKTTAIIKNIINQNDNRKKFYQRLLEKREIQYLLEFKKIHSDLYIEIDFFENIIETINGLKYFDDFEHLQKYFQKYRISETEQAEILSFLIYRNAIFFKSFKKEENINEARNVIIDLISSDEFKKMKNSQIRRHIKQQLKNFETIQQTQLQKYLAVSLIGANGELKHMHNSYTYEEELRNLKLTLTDDQIRIILKTSKKKAQALVDAKTKEQNEKLAQIQAQELAEKKFAEVVDNSKINQKEQRKAIQELKKYLKDDQPIVFINEDDLLVVIKLLKEIGYTANQINEIKKSILLFNQKYCLNIREEQYKAAKITYLGTSEITLLDEIETLLNDVSVIENTLCVNIRELFANVKEKLISIATLADNKSLDIEYEVEYVLMCIEELSKLYTEYKASDYRLLLSQNSN